MGSKRRIAKEILPIILQGRKPDQWYVEPFVGGANLIDKVEGLRLASDSNEYLIEMYEALLQGWNPPQSICEYLYLDIKNNKEDYPKRLVSFVGFTASYRGMFFSSYAKETLTKIQKIRNYREEARNNLLNQIPYLNGIIFKNCSYDKLEIPPNSIIYCDPPYEGTTEYKDKFESGKFWQWCREKSLEGHTVYISEYNAPEDFILLWEKEIVNHIGKEHKKATEKLYTWI